MAQAACHGARAAPFSAPPPVEPRFDNNYDPYDLQSQGEGGRNAFDIFAEESPLWLQDALLSPLKTTFVLAALFTTFSLLPPTLQSDGYVSAPAAVMQLAESPPPAMPLAPSPPPVSTYASRDERLKGVEMIMAEAKANTALAVEQLATLDTKAAEEAVAKAKAAEAKAIAEARRAEAKLAEARAADAMTAAGRARAEAEAAEAKAAADASAEAKAVAAKAPLEDAAAAEAETEVV